MAQSVARQWPALPEANPESLKNWADQITKLLQKGAIASPGGSFAVDELTTDVLITDTIELGHPSDTTLSRLSAGDMAVEGNRVFRVGGADVPVADGGTGAGTAAGARTNLGAVNIAGDTMTGVLTVPAGFFVQALGGSDGGRMFLAEAPSGGTLDGNVEIDVFQNLLRLLENGGSFRGASLDLTACAAGVGTSLLPTVAPAQATTSGTAIDFTGLPSSVSRIIVNINNLSISGTNDLLIQIGDAGGIETTGYVSSSVSLGGGTIFQPTSGFGVALAAAVNDAQGQCILTKVSTTEWVFGHMIRNTASTIAIGNGSKALSAGPLDRVRILPSGADTFDLGSVNIVYD